LLTALARAGYRVRAMTRHPQPALAKSPVTADAGAEWLRTDLDDAAGLARLVADATAVIHCAGAVRGRAYADFADVNVTGTRRVADAMAETAPGARLLVLSSLAARQPQLSHYARSKHAGESVLQNIPRLAWTAFRAPAVYGPGDVELRPTLDMARRGVAAVPGHSGRFSLIFVDDLVDAMLAWVEADVDATGVFELDDGTPEGYDWDEILDVIRALIGRRVVKVPLPHGVMRVVGGVNLALGHLTGRAPMLTPAKLRELFHDDWVVRDTRLRPLLGWQPRVGLAEGLARTFAA
jgi:nucleoside-diphosphate-sugar epimerase